MKMMILCLALSLAATAVPAVPPSFRDTSSPEGWTIVKGQAEAGNLLQAKGGAPLDLKTTEPMSLPVEATFGFRASPDDTITVQAVEEGKDGKPLLECAFSLGAGNQATVTARSAGAPMATEEMHSRTWPIWNKKVGHIVYRWRFPQVKNLWDDRDLREIGAAYAPLTPFAEKVFTLRLTLTPDTRQIWLDDRLVAEDQIASSKPVRWMIRTAKTVQVLSAEFSTPEGQDRFLPLSLDRYSHSKRAQELKTECALVKLQSIPLRVPKTGNPDINLGDSLDRYRLTHGSGPDAGYVSSLCAWPGSFRIDPASLTFRVPYRNYQNVWLLAWVEERPNAVAKATLRFFREYAGYPASTDLEISPEAIRKGLVTKLSQETADGKPLYLVKVPVDTDGLYGMRDLFDQFLEFELSKPVALTRSYPDPIYYGYHPAGLPSSIHVVGITLEEAPFGFQVQPKQTDFVFERPEQPTVTVSVTNTTAAALGARVRTESTSYDGDEKRTVNGQVTVPPGKSGDVELRFDLKKLGWHELKIEVEARGLKRAVTSSLVLLPPNTRTYGNAPNETRFGAWCLDGHYTSAKAGDFAGNERLLALYRRLGLRRVGLHESFFTVALAKQYDFLPTGPHTIGRNFAKWNLGENDPESQKKAVDIEVAAVVKLAKNFDAPTYFYGGEWGVSEATQYAPWPLYTGDGDRPLDDEARKNAEIQVKIFTTLGKAIREQCPTAKLHLQYGAPCGSLAHLRAGIGKDMVDAFGMDAPMFELLPEISNVTGSINSLWMLREEAKRLGWPRLPISWMEGPFFPTTPGGLTERDQMDYQIRYLLLGLGYGVEQFESGIVPQDAGNYYGAEHYGAGIFHRMPLENPKPAVAAVATATTMLCGADVVGPVETGCLTTYCLAFRRSRSSLSEADLKDQGASGRARRASTYSSSATNQSMLYALWRVHGTVDAAIKVRGARPVVTDAMGNASAPKIKDGAITVKFSSSPVWLTGVEQIDGFSFSAPRYTEAPAKTTRPLPGFIADQWSYDGAEDKAYAHNHFAIRRITDSNLKAEFGPGEREHPDAVAIALPAEDGGRPLANRYGALKPKQPIIIPGKASALGVWIKGNSSWGRVVYQCRDAKGEIWTSVGTKDDWNCDDTHGWSYVSFEGWRYVRFPLPGSHPWDSARDLENTWWGSRNGDGIVDLPLTLEKIIVEARNEVPYLGVMKLVPDRSYQLAGLVAEYDSEANTTGQAVADNQIRLPLPDWTGPSENPIARLAAESAGTAPAIKSFVEPSHENDGRQMIIRFDGAPGLTYNLYLSRYSDGRGANLVRAGVKDGDLVTGLRPDMSMYLFLTAVGADKKESKPSAAYHLVTKDNFAEK